MPASSSKQKQILSANSGTSAAGTATTTTMVTAQQQTQATSSSSNPKLLAPTTNPIPLLSSAPIAKPYSIAHTLGIWAYYYLRASSLVASPLETLAQDLLAVAALQAVFCVICLPPSGSWSATVKSASNVGVGESAKSSAVGGVAVAGTGSLRRKVGGSGAAAAGAGGSLSSRIIAVVFSLILTFSVPPVPLTVLALVLGAPLYPTSMLPHTGVLALHVALLGFLPIFYAHGVSTAAWKDVAAAWLPFDEAGVWGGIVGCMIGGWVGAIPIALDWDREWQKWPCTVVWGAVIGWGLGRLITSGLQVGLGKRIDLSEGRRLGGLADERPTVQAAERKTK